MVVEDAVAFPCNDWRMKAVFCPLLILLLASVSLQAVEVTQPQGAVRVYPTMFDLKGNKVATADYTQQVNGNELRVRSVYRFIKGGEIEEKATFRQEANLIQKTWSWRETKDKTLQRSYEVDFDAGRATARKLENGRMREYSDRIRVKPGQTFAGFGFTLALENLRHRLIKGGPIDLEGVGFNPGPIVVPVRLSYLGTERLVISGRSVNAERFKLQPQVPAIAKLFIKVPDTHIWLTPPPSTLLRWEGPLVEPDDTIARVELSPSGDSGPPKPAGAR